MVMAGGIAKNARRMGLSIRKELQGTCLSRTDTISSQGLVGNDLLK